MTITTKQISRRGFVKSSLLASAVLPLALKAQNSAPATPAGASGTPAAKSEGAFPTGKMGDQTVSRLIMGGNLIGGHSHSRELRYVSILMRRYNTESKIRETLEIGEANGISGINTWVMDRNTAIFDHWKAGGKMKWFAQTRVDAAGGFSQLQRAIDEGAAGVHLTGDTCEGLLDQNNFAKIAESVQFIKSRKKVAGVAAHDLRVILECEKAKLDVDFYQKTLHTHDYYTAPAPGETSPLGAHDNSWCSDPQAVIDAFATIKKPWIAFKILAAGGIAPRAGFPYAFNSGADFILVGMFDWQIEENVKLAKRVLSVVSGPNTKRTRPWFGGEVLAKA